MEKLTMAVPCLFGLEGLVGDELRRMPDDARYKLKDALTKIINEGANGLICLLI